MAKKAIAKETTGRKKAAKRALIDTGSYTDSLNGALLASSRNPMTSASRSRPTVEKIPGRRSRVAQAIKATGSRTRRTPVRRVTASRKVTPTPTADSDTSTVVGVRISHPDRLIYPDLGISKIQLARYYEEISDWIVPHVAGRPLTLVHCPAGLAAPCIYLKHAKAWGPSALRRVKIQEKTKVGEYLVADSTEAVVSLAQMGVVEIHTWNSTMEHIERPNRIVWDLDPGPAVTWKQVMTAAGLVRAVLKTLGLTSWAKTTGGRGLHVVVPIKPAREVPECLEFSRRVSDAIAKTDPRLYTTTFAKAGRQRKILIDYLRNNRTNTSVCAYSPRARPGATVSMPLDWSELTASPERWTLLTAAKRLTRLRSDPWAQYWDCHQEISHATFAAVQAL
jgi:bifunctional non-homologous end joining protein LigD